MPEIFLSLPQEIKKVVLFKHLAKKCFRSDDFNDDLRGVNYKFLISNTKSVSNFLDSFSYVCLRNITDINI